VYQLIGMRAIILEAKSEAIRRQELAVKKTSLFDSLLCVLIS
jgi:hypothetical protein